MNLLIIDYGSGNIKSVFNSIKFVLERHDIKCNIKVSNSKKDVNESNLIILPGVGSFKNCKKNILKHFGLYDSLLKNVLIRGKPFLGICVGMQLLSTIGYENGKELGFGWIEGEVKGLGSKVELKRDKLKIPHIGWNNIKFRSKDYLFNNINENDQFYFVHSYYFDVKNIDNLLGYVNYGFNLPAVVKRKNIYGLQFHPEKSGISGQRIIFNWINNLRLQNER